MEYYKKCIENRNFHIRYNSSEEMIILHAPTLAEGLLKVHKVRKEEGIKKAEAREARAKKLEALKADLLEVCKKHNAELLEGKEMERLIDAPYAEDLSVDFPFGIAI